MDNSIQNHGRDQLHAIHAMLASGHASVHLERHTFVLWGLAAAFLILFVPQLFPPDHFTDTFSHMLWQNGFISLVLIGTGILDYRLTNRRRRARDQSLSFVQQQVTKVWWMLIALIVVINIGMNLYGGGSLFYGITLVLIGFGLYIHGLFSRQMLSWGGGLMLLLGLALLAASPEIAKQEWIAASAFGIGLPALAILVNRTAVTTGRRELFLSLLWLGLVLSPATIAINLTHRLSFADWPEVTLQEYRNDAAAAQDQGRIITLPVGTPVPLRIELEGDTLAPMNPPLLTLQVLRPISVPMIAGEVKNRVRIDDGRWRSGHDFRLRDWRVSGQLSAEQGPELNLKLKLLFQE